jgi:hypothetical protein
MGRKVPFWCSVRLQGRLLLPFSDSLKAKFSGAPPRLGQERRRGDAHIVGYYAPAARTGAEEGLGHRDGAKRRVGAPHGGRGGAPTL